MINSHAIASMGARTGARVGRCPPPPPLENIINIFGLYWGPFCYFSSYGGLFATFFSFWGPFHHVGAFSLLFTSWWRPFFGSAPHHTKISAGAHDCKEGSRACFPEIFLCDRNLVSSGHVLLRFCLKNDKNNNKL